VIAPALNTAPPVPSAPTLGISDRVTITVREEHSTDYVLDTELVIEGQRQTRSVSPPVPAYPLDADARPELTLGTRIYRAVDATIHLSLPLGEPLLRRAPYSTVVRRILRTVIVGGDTDLVWTMLCLIDGQRTAADMLAALPAGDRSECAALLAILAATGAIDTSGRQIARFVHTATKKGVIPGGGLDVREVLELVTDGNDRNRTGVPTIRVRTETPAPLEPLRAILRRRRSYRDFNGQPVRHDEIDALLTTACGTTGQLAWAGRNVNLRAYPSSGGLYAVEIYLAAFAVDGLQPGIYRFAARRSALEFLHADTNAPFLDASLPSERAMLSGVAAMICLTGVFPRHETKYGQGGYRMLVAEAGHISQNLLLAATALGIDARPFGGMFDEMVNAALGLATDEEQFLLSVLLGHAG
jgi:SagB-type dehydrogenase family enzyme